MEIMSVLNVFLNSVILFLPNLAAAIVLLLIGWIVGAIIGRITREILRRLKVDQFLFKGKALVKLSDVFPVLFEWIIYLVFIQSAVQILGVVALVQFVDKVINFIPGLLGAAIVIIVGYALAEYIRKVLSKSKVLYSDLVGSIIFWLVLYVAIATALPLVGIDATLINNILLIIVGSFGLGLAIAIGLGLKDTIAEIAKKQLKKRLK